MVTVDDNRLLGIITTLNDEMNLLNTKRTTLRNLSEIVNSIKLLSIPATESTITSTVLPLDPKLGVTIETDRREAIYDKLLLEVTKLAPDVSSSTDVDTEIDDE